MMPLAPLSLGFLVFFYGGCAPSHKNGVSWLWSCDHVRIMMWAHSRWVCDSSLGRDRACVIRSTTRIFIDPRKVGEHEVEWALRVLEFSPDSSRDGEMSAVHVGFPQEEAESPRSDKVVGGPSLEQSGLVALVDPFGEDREEEGSVRLVPHEIAGGFRRRGRSSVGDRAGTHASRDLYLNGVEEFQCNLREPVYAPH
mmetsp:Transcript_17132/g.35651  ORF Transcript_17132/g.35651 Transcript_17132/m.35651 type:complete len:197 (-) Transcript_17132:5922-6512(-)